MDSKRQTWNNPGTLACLGKMEVVGPVHREGGQAKPRALHEKWRAAGLPKVEKNTI